MSQLTKDEENSVEFWRAEYSRKNRECNSWAEKYWPLWREAEAMEHLLLKAENVLINIHDTIDTDDGTRTYFGSTNDADMFTEIVRELERWRMDRDAQSEPEKK